MLAKVILILGALFCLLPFCSSAMALVIGMGIALIVGNPYLPYTRKLTHTLLSLSIMGLGAGMDLTIVGQAGLHGFKYTFIGISLTLVLGLAFGRWLKIEGDTSLLIAVGTAICGGSAIAAVAPIIRAKDHEVSVALATVFLLNAAGLILFPWVGHQLHLSQTQFGFWAALAIHDTSSVVGAALQYGAQALEIGTPVKLARALWIIPLTLGISYLRSRSQVSSGPLQKGKKPWFILGFLGAAALVTWIPALRVPGQWIEAVARRTLILTLFFIGTHLTRSTVRAVGIRPFAQGVGLWILVASSTLGAILMGWIA